MNSMTKSIKILIAVFVISSSCKAQSYVFDVRETSGMDYSICINVKANQIIASRNGRTTFSYRFYNSKIDEKGFLGFSFRPDFHPLLRPSRPNHFFIIGKNGIFCNTSDDKKAFVFKPKNNDAYLKIYQQLVNNLFGEVRTTPQQFNPSRNLTFTVDGVSFTMIYVPGGTFTMGATSEQGSDAENDEKPAHSVTLSSYHIGQTEVTQALWAAVMGSNPSRFKGDWRPVENVSWYDCQTFISRLNEKTGKNFRLPTEAEWEYTARNGNSGGLKYAGSDIISNVAWYSNNSNSSTHNVATKSPNSLGIYDMSGNVWEWCEDWYGDYNSSSQTNPKGPSNGNYRVRRGGSCESYAGFCRVSFRAYSAPSRSDIPLGLRLAL